MNIIFPSHIAVENAIGAEFYVISCPKLNRLYYKGAFVNSDSNWEVQGFALYNYYDEDLGETIYMCVEFSYDTENEVFEFKEFIEPGGHDDIDEAEEYLQSLYNVKLV
ncbi:hypothetical protein [Acinetobacter phage AbTZA1]|uniref:Uncharacterized protein n=1 Tax=Acinetobacter phage AbTZA1 TaxID=2500827 RepID=A0A3Q9R7C6_9CAUD|nr:hypothetical protein HYP74_gp065 [Acinetobacter phage AbTZA1]AZU98684.1 hypothetical protein [Acinetobacter phage AbTZA1]